MDITERLRSETDFLGGLSKNERSVLESFLARLDKDKEIGGLTGFLERLREKGADVSSWPGAGEKRLPDPRQIESALGSDLDAIAEEAGIPAPEASSMLARLVPDLVRRLAPEDYWNENVANQGLNILRMELAGTEEPGSTPGSNAGVD